MVEELAARHALAKEVIEGVTERTGPHSDTRRIRKARFRAQPIAIHGHPTQIRLEPEFHRFLKEIAAEKKMTLKALVESIADTRNPYYSLASWLRVWVAQHFRNRTQFGNYILLKYGTRGRSRIVT
jgi:predicted DNA-binding ribbon-helix-helix protein